MMQTIIYKPIYNLLALATNLTGSLGFGVILITLLIKIILFPFSKKAFESQYHLKRIQPEIDKIKADHGDDKELIAKKTMELYKEKKVNPLSGCLPLILQLVILLGLYKIFNHNFAEQSGYLYNFVKINTGYSTSIFGLDLQAKSILIAVIAGVIQFVQVKLTAKYSKMNEHKNTHESKKETFAELLAKNMQTQMIYIVPFLIGFVSYASVLLALYFITSALFAIVQEYVIYKSIGKKEHFKSI